MASRTKSTAWVSLAGVLLALTFGQAAAEPIDLDGVVFSDELGGFRLVSASGAGTSDDPYVIVEEIHGTGPAVLVVRGAGGRRNWGYGGPRLSFYLRKVVQNESGIVWNRYNLELREDVNKTSDYYDGLSFDQTHSAPRPFRSDRFPEVQENQEPHDSLYFTGAIIGPGQRVSMDVVITDPTPTVEFYLRQSMEVPTAAIRAAPVIVAGGKAQPVPRGATR